MEELFRKLLPIIRKKKGWTKEKTGHICDYKDGSHIGSYENGKEKINYTMITSVLKEAGVKVTVMEIEFDDGEKVMMERDVNGVWGRK